MNPRIIITGIFAILLSFYTAGAQSSERMPAQQDTVRTSLLKEILNDNSINRQPVRDSLSIITDEEWPWKTIGIDSVSGKEVLHDSLSIISSGITLEDIGEGNRVSTEQVAPPGSVTALDYVAPLNELAEFFKIRRGELARMYAEWALAVKAEMDKLELASNNIVQFEDQVREKTYSTYKAYPQELGRLMSELNAERAKAKGITGNILAEKLKTETLLHEMEKQEAKIQADIFKKVLKNISPTTQFPAESTHKVHIYFSEKPQLNRMAGHMDPLNEMVVWLWNVEQSLKEVIGYWNEKVLERIEADKKYMAQLEDMKPYASDKSVKKNIAQLDKDRKSLAKSMAADSKEFAKYIKGFETELKAAYKERLSHIISEMNYIASDRIGF